MSDDKSIAKAIADTNGFMSKFLKSSTLAKLGSAPEGPRRIENKKPDGSSPGRPGL